MKVTNRILERATGFSHPQIKRWAVAFLDPDPAAGQHSGKERTYNPDEAIKIYIGGYLVGTLNFKLKEASIIFNEITSWLEMKGWPLNKIAKIEENVLKVNHFFDWPELIFYIGRGEQGFMYDVEEVVSLDKEGRDIFVKKCKMHYFGDKSTAISSSAFGVIYLTNSIKNFINRLSVHLQKAN